MNSEYFRQYYRDNKEAKKAVQWRYYLAHPKKYLLRLAKKRASLKNIEFSLTEDDFELPTHCPALGIPLKFHFGEGAGGQDDSFCLDRLDNNKGYVKGNVSIISHKANRLKGNATIEELENLLSWYKKRVKCTIEMEEKQKMVTRSLS